MNVVAIVLAIVVILLFYILYRFFLLKSTELTSTASLNDSNPSIEITNSPGSTRYSYGVWIYVNSWDSGIQKTIFERADNIKLHFANEAPILKCDIAMNTDPSTETSFDITDNFPLQKWMHIVISVDNQYVDAYLDGKLVKSTRIYTQAQDDVAEGMPKPPRSETKMLLGGATPPTNYDAYIAKFKHWSSPLDPQTVWAEYKEGNGQSSMKNYISSYGVDLTIIKDNVEQSKYSLF